MTLPNQASRGRGKKLGHVRQVKPGSITEQFARRVAQVRTAQQPGTTQQVRKPHAVFNPPGLRMTDPGGGGAPGRTIRQTGTRRPGTRKPIRRHPPRQPMRKY
jgi:hypothetical protein